MNHPNRTDRAFAFFSLGSNLGDRTGNLKEARRLMEERMGRIERASKVYESSPWGFASDHPFCNICLLVRTVLTPPDLMRKAWQVEKEMGRVSEKGGYADRIIDIDLLLFDDMVMDLPGLVLPHPRMEMRKFVMVPLSEIAPDHIHPVSGLTMAEILNRCQDPSEITPV